MLTHRRFKSCSLSVVVIVGLVFGACCPPSCFGYSVLTHEAIIDAAWKDNIVPLLVKRFPNAIPTGQDRTASKSVVVTSHAPLDIHKRVLTESAHVAILRLSSEAI
jgi:hypothetical protein